MNIFGKYYIVEWSYDNIGEYRYTTISRAFHPMKAGIKVQKQHALPIYIYSIKEGI